MLVPDAALAVHPGHWAEYFANPQHRPMGAGMSLAGRRRDASTFPAEISLSAIDTDEGIIVAAAIQDVTDQLLVKDLERSNHDLESFIYTVSHDLRAPLRALSGYSELLLEEYGEVLGEEGHGYAERIVSVSEQMGQQIDYLLHLSRISLAELHLQSVDLSGEAARIAEEIQRRDPIRPVRFTIQKQVRVLADRRLIRTVLQNLLDNAWKFTSGRDDASIEFGTVPVSGAAVCCYVRDNGAGFDPAYASKLFQPFQRLHAPATSLAPAPGWRPCGGSWNATAAISGRRAPSERVRPSTSPSTGRKARERRTAAQRAGDGPAGGDSASPSRRTTDPGARRTRRDAVRAS